MLVLSDLHGASSVRALALKFIVENGKEIVAQNRWREKLKVCFLRRVSNIHYHGKFRCTPRLWQICLRRWQNFLPVRGKGLTEKKSLWQMFNNIIVIFVIITCSLYCLWIKACEFCFTSILKSLASSGSGQALSLALSGFIWLSWLSWLSLNLSGSLRRSQVLSGSLTLTLTWALI